MFDDDDDLLPDEDKQSDEAVVCKPQTARRQLEDYLEERELKKQLDDIF